MPGTYDSLINQTAALGNPKVALGPGVISLKAHANGDCVCADNAGAAALIANHTTIGAGEEFDLVRG